MSSLFKDGADSGIACAVPSAGDPHRQFEIWCFQEQVVEEAQRLRRKSNTQSNQMVAQSDWQSSEDSQWAASLPVAYNEDINRKLWTTLDPEFMPLPPQERMGLRVLATAAGVIAVMAAGAIITLVVTIGLVVTNVIQIPTTTASASGDRKAGGSQFSSASNFRNLAKFSWALAKMQASDDPPDTPDQALATAFQNDFGAPSRPSPQATVDVTHSKIAAPIATTASEQAPAISLTRDEAASFYKHGQDLIAVGDIVGARMMFKHLADAGDANASFMLASTFDAAVIANLKAVGVQPDSAKARAWYARAAELGSSEAKQRLQQTAQH
jgi:hypothetical protein